MDEGKALPHKQRSIASALALGLGGVQAAAKHTGRGGALRLHDLGDIRSRWAPPFRKRRGGLSAQYHC